MLDTVLCWSTDHLAAGLGMHVNAGHDDGPVAVTAAWAVLVAGGCCCCVGFLVGFCTMSWPIEEQEGSNGTNKM
jgi:hypothetical protein